MAKMVDLMMIIKPMMLVTIGKWEVGGRRREVEGVGGKRVEEGGREEGGSLWEVGAMGGWKVGGTWREEGGGRTGSDLPPKPSCCPNSLRRLLMRMMMIYEN